jgi:F420-non-reducing hydrogenase iron-sulfur subunit
MSNAKKPEIVAFVCHWCAYAGADLAGVSRMQYPANVRMVRVMCTGRIQSGFLLNAFSQGAHGVLVSG